MAERLDSGTEEWPLRPWLMASLCALSGLLFHFLVDAQSKPLSAERQAGATFVAVATLSFVLTIERLRWSWSLAFATGWGLVVAFVGWFTASYNLNGEIVEFPFLSGIAAVLIAAPLFQTIRDEGAWRFPYKKLHAHAWTDAVIGAASLFFTGITFLLTFLIASLFDVIGIDLLEKLLREGWFGWTLAGFAFGGAVGLLRERDRLVGTLQRLVMVVLSVLAPVLAAALALFLISIPFTGLSGLWESWVSAAALLLASSAGAVLLANAVIGDGKEERADNPVLRWSALVLAAVVLPLAALAGFAMAIRIGEYGWTPERIWGAVAVAVAIAYGLAGWWSIYRGRRDFDEALRPMQTRLAIGLCGLALLLALPILDFGAISARSQLARLEAGKVKPEEFDWTAMAFDFGPAGREHLEEISKAGPAAQRELASLALKTENRWDLRQETEIAENKLNIDRRVRLLSPDIQWDDGLKRRVSELGDCGEQTQCALVRLTPDQLMLLKSIGPERYIWGSIIDLTEASPAERAKSEGIILYAPPPNTDNVKGIDLDRAEVEVRQETVQRVYVDGKPVGSAVRISR